MKWAKRGLIYGPDGSVPWASHTALQPTPLLLTEKVIRVYTGFRDSAGVSRIGYVDLAADDPSKILEVSSRPILDVGIDGAFDDNGVVPSAVIRAPQGEIYLYYAGYHLCHKVRFSVLGGLAVSSDGTKFNRKFNVPVFERTNEEFLFRVPHTALLENGTWRFWYGGGSRFLEHLGKTIPEYDIRYLESDDGIDIPSRGEKVLTFESNDEYRVARPYVIRATGKYRLFMCVATKSAGYRLGYAESKDGFRWNRNDRLLGMDVSEKGWDSKMMAYPSVIQTKFGTYMFYNGNDMGKEGFGYAELLSWD